MNIKSIEWVPDRKPALHPGRIRLIDQTRLPTDLVYLELSDPEEVWQAIKVLKVRGAPAIGVAAAMGVVLAVQHRAGSSAELIKTVEEASAHLSTSRPTARNLFWALDRMTGAARHMEALDPESFKEALAQEAVQIAMEDAAQCKAIGRFGLRLLRHGDCVLTHCNAGCLATVEYGTALAPVYLAREEGMDIRVIVDETRPLLQGGRLTAWELSRQGIDVTLICDNMAAQVLREGRINAVLVGADCIAGNGDTANKIGTYGLAVLARAHQVPFYVLAPTTTFDLALSRGEQIPIEQRDPSEVIDGLGKPVAPVDVRVYTPAFDMTPAELITAIVCEQGVARPPYEKSLRELAGQGASGGNKVQPEGT